MAISSTKAALKVVKKKIWTGISIFLLFLSFIMAEDTGTGSNNSKGFKIEHLEWTVVEDSPGTLRIGTDPGEIVLSFKKKSLIFQYIARDSTNLEKSKYAYKMVDFDENWMKTDTGRVVTYYLPKPGEYVFRVKSLNELNTDNTRVGKEISIKVIVLSSRWNTSSLVLLVCLVLVLAVLFYNLWKRKLQKIEKEYTDLREIEQRARKAELQANVARAQTQAVSEESKQKSIELQEARKFQLSMLPQKVPELPHLDIAVSMKTATEVGGDYYDFKVTRFFNQCTETIKKVGLKNLHMALTMLKIEKYKLTVSSAGMPPVFIYRKENNIVETVILKAPPLGAVKKFDYRRDYISVEPGDTVLLLTDGLPELFNRDKKMFGYDRVGKCFKEVGTNSPREIVSHLNNNAEKWLNYKPQDDDMTFVVIKFR
jgi:hypothetical protein